MESHSGAWARIVGFGAVGGEIKVSFTLKVPVLLYASTFLLTLAPLPVGCRHVVPGSCARVASAERIEGMLSRFSLTRSVKPTLSGSVVFLPHQPSSAISRETIGKRVWYIPSGISLTVGSLPSHSLSSLVLLSLFFSRNPFVAGDVVM